MEQLYKKYILTLNVYILIALCASFSFAQSPSISNGINYLQSTQSPEGYWGDVSEVPYNSFVDTCAVVETLNYLNETGTAYDLANQWINSTEVSNNDYLFTKMFVLAQAGFDVSTIRDYLLNIINDDSGWGVGESFESDIKRTTIALQALKAINYPDLDTISSALFYLTNNQNIDGGWGFTQGDDSNVYMTALVLKTFNVLSSTFNVQSSIDNATAYLLSKQNPDGGFGLNLSSIYETALAFEALVVSNADISSVSQPVIDYLLNTQFPNGSWNDDPYSTALALRALANVKPNLTISSSDITFSDPAPTVGDTITITATIHNKGVAQAPSTGSGYITIQFYNGDPDAGGILIGETTIPSIPAFGSSQASIIWTIPEAAANRIFVKIDPLDAIEELDETDNIAYRNLTSATLPDLSITSADIVFNPSPAMPDEVVTITATVRNNGETAAENVTVDFYNGNPDSEGVLISYMVIPSIQPGSATAIQLQESFNEGNHAIYIVVDGANTVEETNETNNTAMKILQVGTIIAENIDLSIISEDITFSPAYPTDGDILTIRTAVNNIGKTEAGNVLVKFYLGDPDSGGIQIGPDINISLIPARSTVIVNTTWDSTGHAGNNDIYVVVDPDDTIPEDNEYNNKAFRTLKVAAGQGPDITLLSSDITFSPPSPLMGDPITISANISNIGVEDASNVLIEFSLGDPDVGGTLIIGSQTIPFIAQGDSVTTQITWDTSMFSGNYEIYVNTDPFNEIAELDELNNSAHVPIIITAPQGPDLTIPEIDTANLTTDNQSLQISGTIDVTLENIGNQDTGSAFTTTAFEDLNNNETLDAGIDNILGEATYSSNLASQVTDIISIALSGSVLFRDNLIYVLTDSNNSVEELDETNNMRSTGQECEYIPPVGTFNPVVKWHWEENTALPEYNESVSPVAVARLTDTNEDGIVDDNDVPAIIFTAHKKIWCGTSCEAVLAAVRGDTGEEIFVVTDPDYRTTSHVGAAVGDIDNDGYNEIVVKKNGGRLMAFEHDGTLKWVSQENVVGYSNALPSIADLDGDGVPEIIVGNIVLNNDGTTRWRGNKGRGRKWYGVLSLVADVDLDGYPEVVAGNTVYKNDGTVHWYNSSTGDGYNAVANFDEDSYPEIVLVASKKVYLLEHDGSIKWGPISIPGGGYGGAPTVSDFDGDGQLEIGVAGKYRYVVFNSDGSVLWQSVIQDYSSRMTGSSVFDFDGDGRAEVVYGDEQYLRIYDGATGSILFKAQNSSNTGVEYPVIADVDNDNRAEIVVTATDWLAASLIDGKGMHGIRVFEDANDNWVNTRKIWNQHTYHITNVNDDGTIPRNEENNWEIYNNYRCNALLPEEVFGSSDITVSYITVDPTDYPELVTISARIGNGGAVSHPAGVEINFYDGDPLQGGILIGTTNTTETLEKGNYEDVLVIWNSPASGDRDIYVVADENNTFNECREDNNTASASFNLEEGIQPPPIEDFPDLEVSSSDITIIPPDTIEGQPAVIAAIIHNIGTPGASDVVVSFYDGEPQSGGVLIDSVTKSYIDAGANALAEVTWDTFGQTGINYIHVVIDPEDLIEESNENNNSSLIQVDVTPPQKPDLAVTSSDIAFSNLNPEEGEPLTISATIHNFGTETPSAGSGFITVELYDGDPSSGGILLSPKTILQIIHFGGEITLDFDIDTIGFTGSHDFYVSVDPNNTIDEISESNNIAWDSLTIGDAGINLVTSTDKAIYTANEDVQITVNIGNLISTDRSGTLDVKILDLSDNVVSHVVSGDALILGPDENKVLNYAWNTGQTLSGDYKVYSHFVEGGNIIVRADTPISISPVKNISSKVTTDKISYSANQNVTITSQITSISPNHIFEDLDAKVSVISSQGETLYTDSNAISILVPNQLVELKTYWNTAQNPESTYTVNLEVSGNPAALSTSTAIFEILGTSQTGEGLTGTITASPDPVYQGQEETITYTITNYGNEDVTNLNVTILIADPDTQEIKAEFSSQYSVNMGETVTEIRTVSTLSLSPKIYLAILQVSSASADSAFQPKSLASTTFEVKPGIEITKTIPDVKNVLVWLNYPWETGQDCPDRALIEQALNEAGVTYYIVLDKKDFQTELRNPYYTDFFILGDHNPIEDHFAEELRELVYSGKGLISSLFNRQNLDEEVFGIKFTGHLSNSDYPVELIESEISGAETFQSYGRALKVEALNPEENIGWIVETSKQGINNYPGIIKHNYGLGDVLFFAFDLGLSSENYSQFEVLLENSLNYIHNPLDATAYYPNQLIPVEIKIKSLGGSFDLRITETYPAEIKLYDPLTEEWVTENPWVMDIHLESDETKTILYYALAPDSAGTYTLHTEAGYLEGGIYNFYQELSLDITVDKDANDTAGDVISALNALILSGSEKSKRDNAVKDMDNVLNRTIDSEKDVEKNIKDIRKAINSLLFITTADISDVRLMMDELLKIWESRYYFKIY